MGRQQGETLGAQCGKPCLLMVLPLFAFFSLAGPHASGIDEQPSSNGRADGMARLAREEPAKFLEYCLERGASRVRDLRCRFLMNARVGERLTGEQVIDVAYRRDPRTVYFTWQENAQGARRMLWQRTRPHGSGTGRSVILEPTGFAGLFVSEVELPLDDPRILKRQRNPISSFGPDATLERIVTENSDAARKGELDLRFHGESEIDGRPTFVFVRHLPYTGSEGPYSDARLTLHIDQQWLIPLSIAAYADRDERILLETDVFTDLRVNLGLTDADLRF